MQLTDLYVFVLAGFVGYQIITRVPALLHTPLMAATNAISGISLVGSLVAAGSGRNAVATILGVIAVTCAMANVVGGFLITDRMLRMFKTTHSSGHSAGHSPGHSSGQQSPKSSDRASGSKSNPAAKPQSAETGG